MEGRFLTCVVDYLGQRILGFVGTSSARLAVAIMVAVGVMSAFKNNIGATAALLSPVRYGSHWPESEDPGLETPDPASFQFPVERYKHPDRYPAEPPGQNGLGRSRPVSEKENQEDEAEFGGGTVRVPANHQRTRISFWIQDCPKPRSRQLSHSAVLCYNSRKSPEGPTVLQGSYWGRVMSKVWHKRWYI